MTTAQDTHQAQAAGEVLAALSAVVLEIGATLDRVYRLSDDFDEWVEEWLPLQPRTAERVRAMWLVWTEHPCDGLPEPWKALWSLSGD